MLNLMTGILKKYLPSFLPQVRMEARFIEESTHCCSTLYTSRSIDWSFGTVKNFNLENSPEKPYPDWIKSTKVTNW